jgi:tyramine---L-glutamate ligase
MLNGLASDFKNAEHNVTVMLDYRVEKFNPRLNVENRIIVHSKPNQMLIDALKGVEATYVVAPESNCILQTIVKSIEDTGLLSLNCQSEAIARAANKATLLEHVKSLGLNVAETLFFNKIDLAEIKQNVNDKLGFPAVVKPANGAGCGCLSIVRNAQQLPAAIKKIEQEFPTTPILVQKLVEGISASVSIISTGIEAVPVSLNRQNVTLASPYSISCYNGGEVPLDNSLKEEAFAVAKRVVESFKGLKGYIGVDIVITEDKVVVIEVNPRLTTSYVGLRNVLNFNLAQAILESLLKKELPSKVSSRGYSYFSKVPIAQSSPDICEKTYQIPQIISPPFSISDNDLIYALVESHGNTSKEAKARFDEAKIRLRQLSLGGK